MALKQHPFTNTELSAFCEQMGMLLKAGLSVTDSIMILESDADENSREIYRQLQTYLEEGDSLGTAMKKSEIFPEYACDMIELGTFSGNADEVMDSLAAHYEREEEIASSLRSAVAYPSVMICMMAAVVIVLITKVLPVFDQVYAQLGSGLTGFAEGLLNFGMALERYSVIIIALLLMLVCSIFVMSRIGKGKILLQKFLYAIPPVRSLQQKIASGRFADGLSIALTSGLSMEESLQLSSRLIADPVIAKRARTCEKLYSEGAAFPEAVTDSNIFTSLHSRMLSIGYQSGSPETILQKIAERHFKETDEQISRLIGILEPALVAILSCVVGLILLSVMLPLLGIMSGIGM